MQLALKLQRNNSAGDSSLRQSRTPTYGVMKIANYAAEYLAPRISQAVTTPVGYTIPFQSSDQSRHTLTIAIHPANALVDGSLGLPRIGDGYLLNPNRRLFSRALAFYIDDQLPYQRQQVRAWKSVNVANGVYRMDTENRADGPYAKIVGADFADIHASVEHMQPAAQVLFLMIVRILEAVAMRASEGQPVLKTRE